MTIRLSADVAKTVIRQHTVGSYLVESRDSATLLASASTPEEAETARLAFERVMLPRFTADEAIAIVKSALASRDRRQSAPDTFTELGAAFGVVIGVRITLEALAAADVFVVEACGGVGSAGPKPCSVCDATGVHQTMADKLDQAGIK